MNRIVAHNAETKSAVRQETRDVDTRAQANLAQARASTHWRKIEGPDNLTRVEKSETATDGLVHLVAPNAMAIEFGHSPSGVFAPSEGRPATTAAPMGLYILTRAAGIV